MAKTHAARILYLVGGPGDADAARRELAGLEVDFVVEAVSSEAELREALNPGAYDAVLAASRWWPGAAAKVGSLDPGVPLVLVVDSFDELDERELVASAVTDIVVRDRLKRLRFSILRALHVRDARALHSRAEAELALERTLLTALLDNSPDQIYFKDRQSRFLRISNVQARRFRLSNRAEAVGKTDSDFFTEDHAREAFEDEQWILNSGASILGKEERETSAGRPDSWVLTDKMPLVDERGAVIGTFGVSRDISEIKQAEERLKFMATHDPLTNLPNRFLMADRLRMGMALSQRTGSPLAVMLIDLDSFKTVNDTLGHEVGDLLLRSFADRVLKCLRSNDTLARMGGDEFVAILSEMKSVEDPGVVAERILAALEEPHHAGGHELFVSSSIGISVYPQDCDSAETLLQNADVAMYAIKSTVKKGYRYYHQERTKGSAGDVVTEQNLMKALTERQFELYYQPIRDADSNGITLAEVLLRWNHPEKGLLEASAFFPVAEKSGLIIPMSEWVLRRACEKKREWSDRGLVDLAIALNISPKHFQIDGFAALVGRILAETGVKPSELFFEITESSAMKNLDKARTTMLQLSELGVRIIIDDFGTGYASLRWLKTMPTYAIKIDRFFVHHILGDPNNVAILRAIISMAHSLGLKVIVGGVETEEQASMLRSLGRREAPSLRCDCLQGYFVGRPAPATELAALVAGST